MNTMKKTDMAFFLIVVLILVYFFSPAGNRMINNIILSVTKTTEEGVSGIGTTSIKEITHNDSREHLKNYRDITIQGTAGWCNQGGDYTNVHCLKDGENNWIAVKGCDIPVFMEENVKLWGSVELRKDEISEIGKPFEKDYYFSCRKKD